MKNNNLLPKSYEELIIAVLEIILSAILSIALICPIHQLMEILNVFV